MDQISYLDFMLKVNRFEGNFNTFKVDIMLSLHKLGTMLENSVHQKLNHRMWVLKVAARIYYFEIKIIFRDIDFSK